MFFYFFLNVNLTIYINIERIFIFEINYQTATNEWPYKREKTVLGLSIEYRVIFSNW